MATLRQKVTKKIILATDPHAFDEGSLLAEVEANERRIANDPEIQERRRIANEKSEREHAPLFSLGIVVLVLMWAAGAYFVPGIITVPGAFLGFAVSNFVWCALNRDMTSYRLNSWGTSASGAAVFLVMVELMRGLF